MAISKVPLSVVVIAWTALVSSATDTAGVVKIGVLTDMTGFLSDIAGPGAVLAVLGCE